LVTQRLNLLWKNEYLRTAIMVLLIVGVVFGFWYGSRWALKTDYPMLAVASGSMSLPKEVIDDGWSRPFAPTLHTGDLIIVQGVKPEDIFAAPFTESGRSGDILVFRVPGSNELIVHRAVGKIVEPNGMIEFITQGDHNDEPGPYSPTPAENVVGKVIMRIPWVGHLALFMHDSTAVLLIVVLIIAVIAIEFALSEKTHKKTENDQGAHVEKASEKKATA
jgi:signal peptidase I